jgi:CBS domain-containing protein
VQLKKIMSTRIQTASPAESAAAAIARMRRSRIRHLVVLDRRKVVGVLSIRDVENLPQTSCAAARSAACRSFRRTSWSVSSRPQTSSS